MALSKSPFRMQIKWLMKSFRFSCYYFWLSALPVTIESGFLKFLITLQSLYRGLQGNPCNENTGPLQWEQGFPVMKTGFSLWELTYREFSVSLTGFGFTVYKKSSEWKPALIAHPYFQAFHRLRIDIAVLTLLECLFLKRVVSSRRRRMFSGLFFWAYQMSVV